MASKNETGHAKNVANLKQLISYCKSYGAVYQPSNKALAINELDDLFNAAEAALKSVDISEGSLKLATDRRQDAFKDFQSYATRFINMLGSSEASDQTVKDARTINRKIQGQRATPKPKPGEGEEPGRSISVSQQSIDLQIAHFSKLIELIRLESDYNPNEAEFKITGMEARLNLMKTTNGAVGEGETSFSNSRANRKKVLYAPKTGLVILALKVKSYVLGIFSTRSDQYKQVSAIEFRTFKR